MRLDRTADDVLRTARSVRKPLYFERPVERAVVEEWLKYVSMVRSTRYRRGDMRYDNATVSPRQWSTSPRPFTGRR